MKMTVGLITLGFIVLLCPVQNSRSPGRQLSVVEMKEIRGGQSGPPGGHEHNSDTKCAHVDWGASTGFDENPCAADDDCPVDVEACVGVQEYESTNTFWKCIPWLLTRTCTVSNDTATCMFSVPCVVEDGHCIPDPIVNGTSLVVAPTSCAD